MKDYHPHKIIPKVSLVGAGPGDPDLLTIKGAKAIAKADVVLYDALSNEDILDLAPEASIKVFVGKRSGQPSLKQEAINLLIVQYAYQYGYVVRLKGGDPFIFGRGYEEVEYLRAFGIEPEIIPGISSSTSLAALQGVPLTSRGISEGFWVLTGTTRTEQLSSDIRLAAQSTSTVVILMGIHKLEAISEQYKSLGRENMPAMVIQNGSLSNEKFVIGTIAELPDLVKSEGITTPGIIVIGETVRLHPAWDYKESLYLYPFNLEQNDRNNSI